MNNYRARFSAQAEVVFELAVQGVDLEEGLATAHDLARVAELSDARVVSVARETLRNISFDSTPARPPASTASEPPAALPLTDTCDYFLQGFSGRGLSGTLLFTTRSSGLQEANSLMRFLLDRPVTYLGSIGILNPLGLLVASSDAARGGWEVEVHKPPLCDEASVVRYSWLPDKEEALKLAVTRLTGCADQVIRIIDFTDRAVGPYLWREIG